jgi:hypothetical protein
MGRNRNIYLVTDDNFDSLIAFIEGNNPIDWFLLFAFSNIKLKMNLEKLRKLKNAVFNYNRSDFLKNVIVMSDSRIKYLANDFGVRAVINIDKINLEIISKFINDFNKLEKFYDNVEEFLLDYGKKNKFSIDIYNNRDPWLMSVNNTGILFINGKTYDTIMENYHKRKNLYPDIIVITFNGTDDDKKCASMLKTIGSDAHMTFGMTSKKSIPYNKRLDGMVYNKSPFKEEYMRKFLVETLESRDFSDNFLRLREFLGVKEKDFSADLFWDEEKEIEKKPIKYLKLKVLIFDKEYLPEIETGFIKNSLTVIRKKKGTFKGSKKIEVLMLEILE